MTYPLQLILLSLGVLGLLSACFLRYQYMRQLSLGKKSFCIIGSDCFEVTSSKYGRTFGLKNEDLGISFYVLVVVLTLFALLRPVDGINPLGIVAFASTLSLAFSLYLLTAQILILKKYCFLCLISIVVNVAIFGISWMLFN